ncbi:FAD-dependent oxidoreductase [Desulfococcaceae bacterium HSG8]|nr:FAD-dependent oxidoreductase [Desulfococcaceae bacterium HSG8]
MANRQKNCDVLVIGGGVAGICASVSAARGARTILVEKNDFPGGTAVIALHRFICGLYINGSEMPADTLNRGIVREISSALKRLTPEKTVLRMGRVYVLPFNTRDIVSVFRSLTEAEKQHLDLLYETHAVSVKTVRNTITSVTVCSRNGKFDIFPKVVADCSGSGVIIRMSGAWYNKTRFCQRQFAGYTFRVKGLKKVDDMTAVKVPYYLAQEAAKNNIPHYLKFTTFTQGDEADEGYCRLSIPPHENSEARNELAKSDALRVHHFLSQKVPSFRDSMIEEMSPEVADREGLRLRGKYTLTREDILDAEKFPDGIVKNAWPIELWNQEKGPCYHYPPSGDYYEIPLRCLKSENISNLCCAGRCISATHEATGSVRVMGTCMSVGEQAGREAAAMSDF